MNIPKIHSIFAFVAAVLCWRTLFLLASSFAWIASGLPVHAQESTGTIEGRVSNAEGEFLENVRLTVDGTSLETYTDSAGKYRFTNVPAGTVKMKAFFTGLILGTKDLTVSVGAIVVSDIVLSEIQTGLENADEKAVTKLSKFEVSASREMAGTAIAINEQRFAPNIKNVVSTEEFGNVAGGSMLEFLKFLPGITVAGREMSIDGVPAANVPVTIDNFSLASAGPGGPGAAGTGRSVEIDMGAINNISRIEVSYTPTPESPGGALAGSVNMVSRSAFERSRPAFNTSAYVIVPHDQRSFNKTPGPREEPTRKVLPGFDFAYIRPVNRRFGFTLTGGYSRQYNGGSGIQNFWRGSELATNGGTFPDTTPDKPYLSSFRVRDDGQFLARSSAGATMDYKLTDNSRISLSFLYSSFYGETNGRILTLNLNRVLPTFTPTSVHGAVAAGSLQLATTGRDRDNQTYTPTIVWRHDGPVWKAVAGLGFSRGNNTVTNGRSYGASNPGFSRVDAQRTGVTVAFDDIYFLSPRTITVTEGTSGVPVDPYSSSSYVVGSASDIPSESNDLQRSAYVNLQREFLWRWPFKLKGGLDFRGSARDVRGGTLVRSFVGADGRQTTTPSAAGSDDGAAPFNNASFSNAPGPFDFPHIPKVSSSTLYDFYKNSPGHFTINQNSDYRALVNESKHAEETISSAYLRADISFMERRLKFVGGVRAEQTNIAAEGPRTDPTLNVQRGANGEPIIGPTGRPLPITTDPLGTSQLTFIERGTHVDKEYLRLFPNINASYSILDNLIGRVAYYQSIGRPNFNQYAGGLTLPDIESAPSAGNRITVNNAGIKAWSARTTSVRVEYYFAGVGQVSIAAFRRDFENFFGSTIFPATPEFLSLYGLDPAIYDGFDISSQYNVDGPVRMSGVSVSYKQALTFLPSWASGFQVFANGSSQRATGSGLTGFTGSNHIPRTASWGLSFTRERYNVRVNYHYRGHQRRQLLAAGRSIEPGTYLWGSERLTIDLLAEYYFKKRLGVFVNFRNVDDAPEDVEVYGPSTAAYGQFRSRTEIPSQWTFGLKGTF
ncbi:MAG: carboxypeptidase regulatory-like domain-containing protein [Opitutaceae bacterium]|nr:carboxypeptidase regulatory-like domain-containing protein [Opitutaceae bacterium]